ncbi:MAG: hypothetical protein IJ932_06420 [Ruminococcus sp.]|nr:hypothetical protein [Ruminococcus sp.]
MKRFFALSVAVLILVFASVPAFAAKGDNPSPTKPTEYNVIIHNPNGGTATYTIEVDEDGQHATLVAHPKNGYEFVGWKINGKYTLESGSLTDEEITILLKSDVDVYPMYKKIGSSSVTSGSSISINSGTTSPKTSDNSAMYFVIIFIALFVVAAGAVGIKLAVSKKK